MTNYIKPYILDHAIQNCSFYNELQIKTVNLKSFPIMTSNCYKRNIYHLLTQKYSGKALNALNKYRFIDNRGFIQLFCWDSSDIIKNNVNLWKFRKTYYKITPDDRCICSHKLTPYGYQINRNDPYVFNNNYLSIGYNFMIDLPKYREMIKIYNPVWISLTSTMLTLLYRELSTSYDKCPFNLAVIEYWGKVIDDQLKMTMEIYFNCKIAYLFGAEFLGVAYELENGSLKIIEENAIVETYNGNIVVSNKNNFCCPILRYCTEFRGQLIQENELILEKTINYDEKL